jgi:hypothetical protein
MEAPMATYTVTGHPLNYVDLGLTAASQEALRVTLLNNGVGATVTLTLSGPDDTKAKGHNVLK